MLLRSYNFNFVMIFEFYASDLARVLANKKIFNVSLGTSSELIICSEGKIRSVRR